MVNSKELDSLGLLRATKVPDELSWLGDEEKLLLMKLLFCGESGMHPREVTRVKKTQEGSDSILRLEAFGMATWERDQHGRPTFLCLTWKGIETAELIKKVAQHENRRKAAAGG